MKWTGRLFNGLQIDQCLERGRQLVRLAVRSDASKELDEEQCREETKHIDDKPNDHLHEQMVISNSLKLDRYLFFADED